jgi:hypothetical protein
MATKTPKGEFYADLDEDTDLYCVFHTETTKAYSSWSSMEQAKEDADRRNHPTHVRRYLRASSNRMIAL